MIAVLQYGSNRGNTRRSLCTCKEVVEVSEIQDFGVKIPGSKKEMYTAQQLTDATLSALSVYDLYRINKKDIWAEPDYKAYCDDGVPAEYMFYVYIVYHSITSKPLTGAVQADDLVALVQQYALFLTTLRDYLLSAVRDSNFAFTRSLFDDFLLQNGYVNEQTNDKQKHDYTRLLTPKALSCNAFDKRLVKLIATTYNIPWPPKGYTLSDMYKQFKAGLSDQNVRIKLLTELPKTGYYTQFVDCYVSGFPYETATCMFGTWFVHDGKTYALQPANARCKQFKYVAPDNTLEALYKAVVTGDCRKYVTDKLNEQRQQMTANREKEVREQAEQLQIQTQASGKVITRIELPNSYVYRKAPKIRKADARTEFLVYAETNMHPNSFGFRGGEFGNWQNKRQECLNCTVDAFSDLAYALDLPYQAMSLCFTGKQTDRIALAWGSRGSGRESAHYEPENAVINLTKYRGAGSLAHEWGHALDHACGKLYSGGVACKRVSDEFMSVMCLNSKHTDCTPIAEALYVCFKDIAQTIQYKPVQLTLEETQALYQKQIADARKWLGYYFKTATQNMNITSRLKYLDDVDVFSKQVMQGEKTVTDVETQLRTWGVTNMSAPVYETKLKECIATVCSIEPTEPLTVTKPTQYYVSAAALDNRTTTKRQYYALPQELFARAFESYVEDKLGAIMSQYLVYGTKENAYRDTFGADIYPMGEERLWINSTIDKLITLIREQVVKSPLPVQIKKFYTTSVFADNKYFADATQVQQNANTNTKETAETTLNQGTERIQYNSSISCEIVGKMLLDGKPAVKLKLTESGNVVVKPKAAVKAAVDAGLLVVTQGAEYMDTVN